METPYDWITVTIFAGLLTRFVQQSSKSAGSDDKLWHYFIPIAGCAGANWLGNNQYHLAAIATIVGTLVSIAWFVFGYRPPRQH